MHVIWIFALMGTMFNRISACKDFHDLQCQKLNKLEDSYFRNYFIAHINGNEQIAQQVARDVGLKLVAPVSTHEDHYYFEHSGIPDVHKMKHVESVENLQSHDKVISADQQFVWNQTLHDMDDFKDVVSHETPSVVEVTTIDPDTMDYIGEDIKKNEDLVNQYYENLDKPWKPLRTAVPGFELLKTQ